LQLVDRVKRKVESMPCLDTNSTEPPPQLDLEILRAGPAAPQSTLLPFFDRFWKPANVDGLAGTPTVEQDFLPIDFTQMPEQVTTLSEALDALRIADTLCSLVDAQKKGIEECGGPEERVACGSLYAFTAFAFARSPAERVDYCNGLQDTAGLVLAVVASYHAPCHRCPQHPP